MANETSQAATLHSVLSSTVYHKLVANYQLCSLNTTTVVTECNQPIYRNMCRQPNNIFINPTQVQRTYTNNPFKKNLFIWREYNEI